MAQASTTEDDYQILSAQTLDLQNIRGIGKKVRLFADGSMQWQEKDKTKCTSATNGITQKTLIQWDLALAKKEQNWLSRLLGQKPSITAMRHSLATWNQQLAKLEATKHAMANKP